MKRVIKSKIKQTCYEHPRRKAVAECIGCGQNHCSECASEGGCLSEEFHELKDIETGNPLY